jgi:hypothetical protein
MVTVSRTARIQEYLSWLSSVRSIALIGKHAFGRARTGLFVSLLSAWMLASPSKAWSQPAGCIRLDQVSQWEIINSFKVLAYDTNKNYLAFLSFYSSSLQLKPGGSVNLRFFSPSICPGDNVIVNGQSTSVSFIEIVRRN